jgi:hypothetical protein
VLRDAHVKDQEHIPWYVPPAVIGVQILLSFLLWRFHLGCLP